MKNTSLSTSGNTAAYSNHIVNPLTGRFNNEKQLVCVTSDCPIIAEVLSTVLMIISKEDIEGILEKFQVESFKIFKLT